MSEPNAVILSLAQAQHEIWLIEMVRQGWKPGLKTDESKKVHAWLLGWAAIPEAAKAEYMERVKLIPRIIRKAGLALVEDIGAQAESGTRIMINKNRRP